MPESENRYGTASLILSILAVVIALVSALISWSQLGLANDQLSDARASFEQSGPVLTAETSVQFDFADARKDPDVQTDEEHPQILARDFQTYDAIYLAVSITNVGRLDSTISSADLLVRKQAAKVDPSSPSTGSPEEAPDPTATGSLPSGVTPAEQRAGNAPSKSPSQLPIPVDLCSNQGGTKVRCTDPNALPYNLAPGKKYYLYFSLKDHQDVLRQGEFTGGVPIRIVASGIKDHGQLNVLASVVIST